MPFTLPSLLQNRALWRSRRLANVGGVPTRCKVFQCNLMYCNQSRPSKLGPLPETRVRGRWAMCSLTCIWHLQKQSWHHLNVHLCRSRRERQIFVEVGLLSNLATAYHMYCYWWEKRMPQYPLPWPQEPGSTPQLLTMAWLRYEQRIRWIRITEVVLHIH